MKDVTFSGGKNCRSHLRKVLKFLFIVLFFSGSLSLWSQNPPCPAGAEICIDGNPAEWPSVITSRPYPQGSYFIDPVNSSIDNIWTGGSSDVSTISLWTTKSGEPNNSNDLKNAGSVTINNVAYFYADRFDNNGDSSIGYWLLQGPVEATATGFTGAHQDGDILLRTHFVNGGGTAERAVYIWYNGGLKEVNLTLDALNFKSNPADNTPLPGGTWAYSSKDGAVSTYPENTFVEGFLNLNALETEMSEMPDFQGFNFDPCFSYFIIEAGNAPAINSSLEDLVFGKYGLKPASQSLTGAVYCESDASLGTVSMADSEMGILYQLQTYNESMQLYENIGNPIPGSGENIGFQNVSAGTYYVKAYVEGSECFTRFGSVEVQVNSVDPGKIGPDLTICEGDDPPVFRSVTAEGSGSVSYQWQVSLDSENWRTYTNATSETFDPDPLTEDRWFRRIATSILEGVECSEMTDPVKITVNNVTSGFIGPDQTICEGEDPQPLLARSDEADGDFSYQWLASTDNSVWRTIPGEEAKNATFDPGTLIADRWYKRILTSTLNGVECTSESNVIKITVINFVPGEIGPDRLICAGDDPDVFRGTAASGDGSFKYQWQDSADGEEWTNIRGATEITYDPGQLEKDTYFRRLTTATLNEQECSKESNAVLIYVNNVEAGNIAGDQVLCSGGDPALISGRTGSGDGELSYQWLASVDGDVFRILEGATEKDYDPDPFPEDARWYKRVTTSIVRDLECTAESNIVKVSKNNVTAGAIGPDQTICEGEDAAQIGSRAASADGRLTYYWLISADGENYEVIENATDETFSPGKLSQDHWYRRGAVSTIGDVSCRAVSDPVKITVNNLTPGEIGADQTICEGEEPSALTTITAATGDAALTYQWQVSTDGSNFSDVPTNGDSETYAPGVLYADHWYRRVATGILAGKECERTSDPVKITVENCIVCESAFAKANVTGIAHCFIDDDGSNDFEENPNSERWGWSNEFNAGDNAFTATMELYQGAGRCVTKAENLVGLVSVNYDPNGTITVAYDITKYGHAMSGVHLYVGCEPYPMQKKGRKSEPSVAPGKYSFNMSSNGYFDRFVTDPIQVDKGTFYVIAHANVCTSEKLWLYPILVDNDVEEHYTSKSNKPLEYVCEQPKVSGKNDRNKFTSTNSVSTEEMTVSGDGNINVSPVPFSNVINVSYDLEYTSDVSIEIFDFKGQLMKTTRDTDVSRGSSTVIGIDFKAKGKQMYLLRITTDRETFIKQVISQ